jgi:hypothetical protein
VTGAGTIGNPYVIQNVTDLQNISLFPSAYYILGNNIDCTGFPFTPIAGFLGNLNGQSKQINHLSISAEFNACLFDYPVPAGPVSVAVSNITFNDINLANIHSGNVGIFGSLPVGSLSLSKIFVASGNCSCGDSSNMGGLVGIADVSSIPASLAISQCYTYLKQLCITNSAVGGLIGIASIDNNQVISILNAYARGSIVASSKVGTVLGGIIGEVFDDTPGLTLQNVYSTVAIPVGLWRGGLIGYHTGPG